MKEALECLDGFINRDIAPTNIMLNEGCDEQSEKWCFAAIECERMRQDMLYHARQAREREGFTLFIQHYQVSLVDFLDRLFAYKQITSEPAPNKLYDKTTVAVESLYRHAKKQYRDFFNANWKIPDKDLHLAKQEMREQLPAIRDLIREKGIQEELMDIVLEPICGFMAGTGDRIENEDWVGYLKHCLYEIHRWANRGQGDPDWSIILLVVDLNLNSVDCCNYCVDYLWEMVMKAGNPKEKLEWIQQKLRDRATKQSMAYDGKEEPLKLFLEKWALNHLAVMEEKEKLPEEAVRPGRRRKTRALKFLTGFTVEALSFITRLEKKCGRFENKEIIEVMEIVADTYSTKNQPVISAESLAKEKAPKAATRDFVIAFLKNMLWHAQHSEDI